MHHLVKAYLWFARVVNVKGDVNILRGGVGGEGGGGGG